MLVQIPIPATGGYANLGDGIILVCAFLIDLPCAIAAAGLGSMLADLLAGYIAYAPGTLVIKAMVAGIAGWLFSRLTRSTQRSLILMITAGVLAEIFMVLGYFLYESVVLGMGLGALGAIIGNIGQGAVGVFISCAVAPFLMRSDELRDLIKKTKR